MDVALIPRDFLSHLFGHFELPLPEAFNNNNITQTLGQLGKIPDGLAGDTSRWVATRESSLPWVSFAHLNMRTSLIRISKRDY
jgi:hypothetical protein